MEREQKQIYPSGLRPDRRGQLVALPPTKSLSMLKLGHPPKQPLFCFGVLFARRLYGWVIFCSGLCGSSLFFSTLPAESTPNVLNQKGGKARVFAPSARLISVLFGQFFGESGTPGPSREAPGTA